MDTVFGTVVLACLLATNVHAVCAEEAAAGRDDPRTGGDYPKVLDAAELQKLYSAREIVIESTGSQGKMRYEVMPDGRLFGHNDSVFGISAARPGLTVRASAWIAAGRSAAAG